MILYTIFILCIVCLLIVSLKSYFDYLHMCSIFDIELENWIKKDWRIEIYRLICTQKENKIEDLKNKLQREQTLKSNARQSLKQRTKEKQELLKIIRNSAT